MKAIFFACLLIGATLAGGLAQAGERRNDNSLACARADNSYCHWSPPPGFPLAVSGPGAVCSLACC